MRDLPNPGQLTPKYRRLVAGPFPLARSRSPALLGVTSWMAPKWVHRLRNVITLQNAAGVRRVVALQFFTNNSGEAGALARPYRHPTGQRGPPGAPVRVRVRQCWCRCAGAGAGVLVAGCECWYPRRRRAGRREAPGRRAVHIICLFVTALRHSDPISAKYFRGAAYNGDKLHELPYRYTIRIMNIGSCKAHRRQGTTLRDRLDRRKTRINQPASGV